jgi:hypothetical protein
MRREVSSSLAAAGLVLALSGSLLAGEPPKVQIPNAGVPQIMTMEGRYIRAAYNNEAYVILGYKVANLSVGENWMLLDVGVALREGVPDYTLAREAVSLSTPDGKTIPLPSLSEYRKVHLSALQQRAKVQRDSVNYFPPTAYKPCRIGFFSDLDDPAHAWDSVDITNNQACLGRFYFPVAGGIAYGQHWLNVKFAKSVVRVPFRILTKEEDKLLDKNYEDIAKQVENAFKKKD